MCSNQKRDRKEFKISAIINKIEERFFASSLNTAALTPDLNRVLLLLLLHYLYINGSENTNFILIKWVSCIGDFNIPFAFKQSSIPLGNTKFQRQRR